MKFKFIFLTFLFLTTSVHAAAAPSILHWNLSSTTVPKYDLFEVEVILQSAVHNPYNYDSITLTATFVAPSGQTKVIEGFFFQNFVSLNNGLLEPQGTPFWKLRFTPNETGIWHFSIKVEDVFGVDSVNNLSFQCVQSSSGGFLHLPQGTNYFKNEAGKTVFLVGENIAWANQADGSDRMSYFLDQLSQHQMNFAKLMMTPWGYQIEWWPQGLKNYSNRQKEAFLLDSVFSTASQKNIHLLLGLSIHDELNISYFGVDWNSNPYNIQNGGMCTNVWDFFILPEAKAAFKNRLRYVAARWGYAPHLIGWELLSEADNFSWYSTYKNQIAAWANEMATYLRQIDPNNHLVSVGFALQGSNPMVWQHQDIGFTQMHLYDKVSDIEGDVFRQVGMYSQKFQKPMIVGEFGLGHHGDTLVVWDPDGLAIHNALWTSALSGSPATILPWFWENYIDVQYLYPVFTPIALFMADEQLTDTDYLPTHIVTKADENEDWIITPKYSDLSTRAPSKSFELHTTGQIIPATDSLSQMLFGPTSLFAALRQPPELSAYWQQPTMITIETGVQAVSAVLQVSLDGVVILETTASSSTEYFVEVPAGQHILKLDNSGTGFFSILEIQHITIHDFLPPLRAFGLLSSESALIWAHNRNSNWKWAFDQSQAPPTVSGELRLPFENGIFQLDWYNSWTGTIDSVTQASTTNSMLVIPVMDLQNDLALKINRLVGVDNKKPVYPTVIPYPNPSSDGVNFVFESDQPQEVTLRITDIHGRLVFQSLKNFPRSGLMKFYWEGFDCSGNKLHDGIYFYQLILSNEKVLSGRLLRK